MRTRYVLTHLAKDGLRTLVNANQGRNHYDTREEAEHALEALAPQLRERLGMRALEVRATECYDHGDAVSVYSDTDFQEVTGTPFSAVCCSCGRSLNAGDGAEKYGHGKVYADTTGTPWKAYYCTPCAQPSLTLQEVTRATRNR